MANVIDTLKLYNHEAEATVIGSMLADENFAARLVQQLEDSGHLDLFHNPRNKVMFQAFLNLLRGIEPINRENLAAECRRVAIELNEKQPVSVPIEYINSLPTNPGKGVEAAFTIQRLAWIREAGGYAEWFLKAIQMNPDPSEFYAEAQERWQVLSPKKKEGATLYGWDTIAKGREIAEQRAQEAQLGMARRFDWPKEWPSWNEYIRPARAGMLYLLAAPDGVGKSTYLEWIAEHWAIKGNKVVLLHLEDDHEYKLDRRKARWAKVPLADIEDGTLTAAQQKAVDRAEDEISAWASNLHYTHLPGATCASALAEAQKLVDEGECQALVIDYADKFTSDRRQVQLYGDGEWSRQGDDIEQLKTFAERNRLPVFTATQGNKGMQDQGRVITRKDIEGSGRKSQRSQCVILVTREILTTPVLDDKGKTLAKVGDYSPYAKLRVDKQNRGWTGTFYQLFRGEYYRIGDLPKGFKPGDDSEEL